MTMLGIPSSTEAEICPSLLDNRGSIFTHLVLENRVLPQETHYPTPKDRHHTYISISTPVQHLSTAYIQHDHHTPPHITMSLYPGVALITGAASGE
jgi:hypothetical protein